MDIIQPTSSRQDMIVSLEQIIQNSGTWTLTDDATVPSSNVLSNGIGALGDKVTFMIPGDTRHVGISLRKSSTGGNALITINGQAIGPIDGYHAGGTYTVGCYDGSGTSLWSYSIVQDATAFFQFSTNGECELSIEMVTGDSSGTGIEITGFVLDGLANGVNDLYLRNQLEQMLTLVGTIALNTGVFAFIYDHTSAASGTWTINHNLGHYPIVQAFDMLGAAVSFGQVNPTLNQTVLTFIPDLQGTATFV